MPTMVLAPKTLSRGADIHMRFTTIPLLIAGAGLATANLLHVWVAAKDVSPICIGHAAANVGQAGVDK
jgi:hypothetical protein